MSSYIPSDHVVMEFQGDTITFDMEPITSKDFGQLMPYYVQGDDGNLTLRFEDQMAFSEVAGGLLRRYVTNFAGLTDARGNAVPFETVMDKMYFMPLKAEMVSKLFALSTVKPDDEKKSEEPCAGGSLEQADATI